MKQEKKKVLYTLTKSEREDMKKFHYIKVGLLDMIEMVEKAKSEMFKLIAKKAGKGTSEISIHSPTGRVTER